MREEGSEMIQRSPRVTSLTDNGYRLGDPGMESIVPVLGPARGNSVAEGPILGPYSHCT